MGRKLAKRRAGPLSIVGMSLAGGMYAPAAVALPAPTTTVSAPAIGARPPSASASSPPERGPPPLAPSPVVAAGIWAATQLVPSPLVVLSKDHVGGGARWQLTPVLYSFGISERPWRFFFVTPIARHAGSVEAHASPEWACCPGRGSSWLLRTGLRLYLPLLERGEKLSWSLGGSYYLSRHDGGAAADLGLYTFNGVLGVNVTASPWLARREVVAALTIRYF